MRALVVFVLVVLLAPQAHAQPAGPADRDEARRAFEAGQLADRRRDWQAAIDHYLRANDLVPHPNTMFNIAVDYERLGKLREAAVWYQRYIEAAPDSRDRARVTRKVRELRDQPGTLTVRSIPDGARVFVDRRAVGVTPYSGHIRGGRHVVRVERDGMREERRVDVEFGEPVIVDIALRGATGTLQVVGTPPGALVTIDETPAGALPLQAPLAPGVHAVRISQAGYEPHDTRATIEPNRVTVVRARLVRALGTFGDTKPSTLKVGYLVGAAGGVDARGDGALGLFELGVRAAMLDGSVRIGKTVGMRVFDLLLRWTVTKGRLAPFASVGYTIISSTDDSESSGSGSGYLLTAGLRYDLARGERYSMSLLAESGIRTYQTGDASSSGEIDEDSGLVVPVMTTLQIMYK